MLQVRLLHTKLVCFIQCRQPIHFAGPSWICFLHVSTVHTIRLASLFLHLISLLFFIYFILACIIIVFFFVEKIIQLSFASINYRSFFSLHQIVQFATNLTSALEV